MLVQEALHFISFEVNFFIDIEAHKKNFDLSLSWRKLRVETEAETEEEILQIGSFVLGLSPAKSSSLSNDNGMREMDMDLPTSNPIWKSNTWQHIDMNELKTQIQDESHIFLRN